MSAGKPTAPLVVHGWAVFAHPLFLAQLEALTRQVEQIKAKDPAGYAKKNASKRLAAVEITLKDAPKHDDLAKIYERVNRLTEEVKGLVGEFAGAKHTLGLLHQFLLNGGGQR